MLLAVFFHIELRELLHSARAVQLTTVAEQEAATLDLFLSERIVNLSNVIGDPAFPDEPGQELMEGTLASLRQTSEAFVEIGVLNADGRIVAYAGPHPALGERSYRDEPWFVELRDGPDSRIITDIYRGFRDQPHFTVAVKRLVEGDYRVLRAVLSPDRIYEELVSGTLDSGLQNALVNGDGVYQVVDPQVAQPLTESVLRPPREPGAGTASTSGGELFGYAWLAGAPWALVVHGEGAGMSAGVVGGLYRNFLAFTLIFFVLGGIAIWLHARMSVRRLWKARSAQRELSGQLVQAAKLASVGELAAGIAHEINNPLAIIAEEVGLLQDLMDPELGGDLAEEDLKPHLDTMHEAVFRGRDITRKLLGFVRKTEVRFDEHDVHDIVDEVADGFLGRELELSNVKVVKEYGASRSRLVTDRNQLEQVLLNLMKNAVDAMEGKGALTLTTETEPKAIKISVADTGCGMSREQLERIFQPFFTTKDPGKGTGLGLSVSNGIVESLGGKLYVHSEPGQGSVFTVELPYEEADS